MTTEPNTTGEPRKRLADVLAAYMEAIDTNETSDLGQWLSRYPEYANELTRYATNLQGIEQILTPLRTAAGSASLEGCLGDYRILREIGRGGMGIVYDVEQISLRRRVALKVLPFASVLDDRQKKRFQNEAQAAALLRHPNIVGVHAVGCERGVHYYAMDLIQGQSLAEVINQLRHSELKATDHKAHEAPETDTDHRESDGSHSATNTAPVAGLSTEHSSGSRDFYRSAVRLAVQAAEALDYAHQEGVIHRDIKPSNLLLDKNGKLWITDFGLAHVQGDHSLTMTGDVLGTLRYMSPEQASGVRSVVDHRTDVYSLGVTLYELLTLRPAFGGDDRQKLLRYIGEADPPAPRKVNSAIPKDLETIVLKAITKEPHARYGTASELAEDLQRYLEHRPIRARRTGRLNHLWRWAKRKPAVAALTATVLTLLLFLAVAGPLLAVKQASLISEAHRQNYIMAINAAHQAWKEGNLKRMHTLLARQEQREDLLGFEYHLLRRLYERHQETLTLRHEDQVWSVAFSPDGKFVATASRDGKIRIWDLSTRQTVRTLTGHSEKVYCVAFSPDGRKLASGSRDATVKLWDPLTGQLLSTLTGHSGVVDSVAFSSDGQLLASGGKDTTVRLWNVAQGTATAIIERHTRRVYAVVFSPKEPILASAGSDHDIMLWDVSEGKQRAVLAGHKSRITALAFTGDGKTLASGGWGVTVKLWNVATYEEIGELATPRTLVTSLAFSPDGQTLAVGSENNSVSLWSVQARTSLATIRGHREAVSDVVFSVDGQTLATASSDSTVKFWKVARYRPDEQYVDEDWRTSVAFAPKGNVLASALGKIETPSQRSSGEIQLWDVALAENRVLVSDEIHWLSVSLSPDERNLAAGGVRYDGEERVGVVGLWNVSTGKRLYRFDDEAEAVWSVAFSPDGEQVATGAAPKGVRLRHATTGALICELDPSFPALSVAFSPLDGRHLAAGGGRAGNGVLKLWDTTSGRELASAAGHTNFVMAVAFSPDGRTLAAGDAHGDVKLWDVATLEELKALRGQTGVVTSVAFSPDGKTLASGRVDRTVKLWHIGTGDELMTLDASFAICCLAFAPDGKTLAAGCGNGGVTLWHAGTERRNWRVSLR